MFFHVEWLSIKPKVLNPNRRIKCYYTIDTKIFLGAAIAAPFLWVDFLTIDVFLNTMLICFKRASNLAGCSIT